MLMNKLVRISVADHEHLPDVNKQAKRSLSQGYRKRVQKQIKNENKAINLRIFTQ
jgi:hypothetical protein